MEAPATKGIGFSTAKFASADHHGTWAMKREGTRGKGTVPEHC
jgi:hypothetical protein